MATTVQDTLMTGLDIFLDDLLHDDVHAHMSMPKVFQLVIDHPVFQKVRQVAQL